MTEPLVSTSQLAARYGDAQVLFGIDFEVEEGELVAIIGANGAGKSTFMKALTGLVAVPRGQVCLRGEPIGGLPPGDIVRRGMTMVPEGRRLFPSLSVEDNLRLGGHTRRPGPWTLDRVYGLFPALARRRHAASNALSGGEQQQVAIGRALMSNPRVLLCDELSLGLAPIVVREIYASMPALRAEGMTVVIVEQDVALARQVSQRVYCFMEGRVALTGRSDALSPDEISRAYFGDRA